MIRFVGPAPWPDHVGRIGACLLAVVVAVASACDPAQRPIDSRVVPSTANEPGFSGDPGAVQTWPPGAIYGIQITWVDTYDGIDDSFSFWRVLDTIDPGSGGSFLHGTGTVSGSRYAWGACNPGLADVPAATDVAAEFYGQIDGDQIGISAFATYGTALAGVSTGVFTLPIDGGHTGLVSGPGPGPTPSHSPTPPDDSLCPRTWWGEIWAVHRASQ